MLKLTKPPFEDKSKFWLISSNENKFRCPICPGTFTRGSTLKRHMRTVHIGYKEEEERPTDGPGEISSDDKEKQQRADLLFKSLRKAGKVINQLGNEMERDLPVQQKTLLAQLPILSSIADSIETRWRRVAHALATTQENSDFPMTAIIGYSDGALCKCVHDCIVNFGNVLTMFSFTTRVKMRGNNRSGVRVPEQTSTLKKYSSVFSQLLMFVLRIAYIKSLDSEVLKEETREFVKVIQANSPITKAWRGGSEVVNTSKLLIDSLQKKSTKNESLKCPMISSILADWAFSLFTAVTDDTQGGASLVYVWLAFRKITDRDDAKTVIIATITQDISAVLYCFFACMAQKVSVTDRREHESIEDTNGRVDNAIALFKSPSSCFTQLVTLRSMVKAIGEGTDRMPVIHYHDQSKFIFQIEDEILSLSTLKQMYAQLVKDLKPILFEHLLFGVCDDWLRTEEQVQLIDNLSCPILHTSFVSQNPVLDGYFNRFLREIASNVAFQKEWGDKVNVISMEKIAVYERSVCDFIKKLVGAGKLTEGMPSRAPEQLDWTFKNEVGRKRTIFLHQGHIALVSGYSKTRSMSMREKVIARFYPIDLSHMVILYVSICLPFQKTLLSLKMKAETNNINEAVKNTYAQSKLVMDSTFMSVFGRILEPQEISKSIMMSFTHAHCESGRQEEIAEMRRTNNESERLTKFGIKRFRHAIVALMRLMDAQAGLQDPNISDLDDERVAGDDREDDSDCDEDEFGGGGGGGGSNNAMMAAARAQQAGHSLRTANTVYGIGGGHTSSLSTESWSSFFATSTRWHERMGVGKNLKGKQARNQLQLALVTPRPESDFPCLRGMENHVAKVLADKISFLVSDVVNIVTDTCRQQRVDLKKTKKRLKLGMGEEKDPLPIMATLESISSNTSATSPPGFRSDHQRLAVEAMLANKSNVFYHATTAGGKTFAALLVALVEQRWADELEGHRRIGVTVLILPFALLKQEVEATARKYGISTAVFKSTLTYELDTAQYQGKSLLIATTTLAVTEGFRPLLLDLHKNGGLRRIIIDEAHEISVSSSYRKEMSKLKYLREEPLHTVPMCLMSATVPLDEQPSLMNEMSFDIEKTSIVRSPTCNRPNLQYVVHHICEDSKDNFVKSRLQGCIKNWLIKERHTEKKMMVFFTFISVLEELHQATIQLVQDIWDIEEDQARCALQTCYRRNTGKNMMMASDDDQTQNPSWASFCEKRGPHRILFATCGAGAGVNAPDVNCVIEYGAGSSIPLTIQKFGRACRSDAGEVGRCIVIVNETMMKNMEKLMEKKKSDVERQEAQCHFRKWAEWVRSHDKRCLRESLVKLMDGEGATVGNCDSTAPCSYCFINNPHVHKTASPGGNKEDSSAVVHNNNNNNNNNNNSSGKGGAVMNGGGGVDNRNRSNYNRDHHNDDDDDDDDDEKRRKKIKIFREHGDGDDDPVDTNIQDRNPVQKTKSKTDFQSASSLLNDNLDSNNPFCDFSLDSDFDDLPADFLQAVAEIEKSHNDRMKEKNDDTAKVVRLPVERRAGDNCNEPSPPISVSSSSVEATPPRLHVALPDRNEFPREVHRCIARYGHVKQCPLCYTSDSGAASNMVQSKCPTHGLRCHTCLGTHVNSDCPAILKIAKYKSGTCCFTCGLPERSLDFHVNSNDESRMVCLIERDVIRKVAVAMYTTQLTLLRTTFRDLEIFDLSQYMHWLYRPSPSHPFLNMVRVFVLAMQTRENRERARNDELARQMRENRRSVEQVSGMRIHYIERPIFNLNRNVDVIVDDSPDPPNAKLKISRMKLKKRNE